MAEQLAIVKQFHIGMGERGHPAVWFSTYITECSAAQQVIEGPGVLEFILEVGLADVTKVEGRPCWVDVEGQMIRFLRMAKL